MLSLCNNNNRLKPKKRASAVLLSIRDNLIGAFSKEYMANAFYLVGCFIVYAIKIRDGAGVYY